MDNETTILAGLTTIIRKLDSADKMYKVKPEPKEKYTYKDYADALILIFNERQKKIVCVFYRDYLANCKYTGLRQMGDGCYTFYDGHLNTYSATKYAVDALLNYTKANNGYAIQNAIEDIKNGAPFDIISDALSYYEEEECHFVSRRALVEYVKDEYKDYKVVELKEYIGRGE